MPPAQPVNTTTPGAAAPTGVPQLTAVSSPVWSFQTRSTGWNRSPNGEDLRPETGRVRSLPGAAVETFDNCSTRIVDGAVGTGTTSTELAWTTSGVTAVKGSKPGSESASRESRPDELKGSAVLTGRSGRARVTLSSSCVVTTGAGTAWSVSSSSGVASEATATMPHATAAARTAVSPRTTMFDPPVDREPTYANTVGRPMEGLGRIARPHTVDPRPQEALNLIVRSAETSTSSGSRRIEGTEPPMSMNMAAFPAPR